MVTAPTATRVPRHGDPTTAITRLIADIVHGEHDEDTALQELELAGRNADPDALAEAVFYANALADLDDDPKCVERYTDRGLVESVHDAAVRYGDRAAEELGLLVARLGRHRLASAS